MKHAINISSYLITKRILTTGLLISKLEYELEIFELNKSEILLINKKISNKYILCIF